MSADLAGMESWFLTFPQSDDRHDQWVRIEASTKDEVRAFAVSRYGIRWDELIADVEFNPDLYPGGELAAFRVEGRQTASSGCAEHAPVQHRDGKPPWCPRCGLTSSFEQPLSRFGQGPRP